MTELLTAAQMRAIEQAAIASGEVTGLELMERAGRAVVEAIFEEWPELQETSHRAVVLCGPGNNGGDGFVVARLLKDWGWEVEVFLYGAPEKMPPEARVNYERWLGMGEVRELVAGKFENFLLNYGMVPTMLVVDALFGTGLSRFPAAVMSVVRSGLDALANTELEQRRYQVAVDLPSGVSSDGALLGNSIDIPFIAELTVSFHRAKVGHYLGRGPSWSGKLVISDIALHARPTGAVTLVDSSCIRSISPSVEKQTASSNLLDAAHKYAHGHALILSGPQGRTGAARLAARGALRIGAGLATLGCPPEAIPENAARLDAIMLRPIADAAALRATLMDQRITALCLGPGLGVDRATELLATAMGGVGVEPRPTVLDADALTALAASPDLFARLHSNCVLTPHGGEFARLFPDIAERLAAPATKGPAYSKVDATREAAKRAGCVVLYKGPDTVIADPSGRCAINSAHYDRAAPWLATAGSGDVLAGFITGLLARGFAPMQAAESAAWLHVECARHFGPGLIAEDIPEQLPAVFRALGL